MIADCLGARISHPANSPPRCGQPADYPECRRTCAPQTDGGSDASMSWMHHLWHARSTRSSRASGNLPQFSPAHSFLALPQVPVWAMRCMRPRRENFGPRIPSTTRLDWADLDTGPKLLVPRAFDPATGTLRLITEAMIYRLRAFRDEGSAVWDIGVCFEIKTAPTP